MREILFRGKRIDNGEWVYGLLCQYHEGVSAKIALNDFGAFDIEMAYCVDPATIGQYTGLTDKSGAKIFEGDFIRNQDGDIGRVTWYPEHVAFMIYCINKNEVFDMAGLDSSAVEVIDNIHNNPDLLTCHDNG